MLFQARQRLSRETYQTAPQLDPVMRSLARAYQKITGLALTGMHVFFGQVVWIIYCCGFVACHSCFYELFGSTAAAYVLTAGHSLRVMSSRWCAAGKKLLVSISLRRHYLLLRRHPRPLETLRAFPQMLEENDCLDTARSSFHQAASATRCLSG